MRAIIAAVISYVLACLASGAVASVLGLLLQPGQLPAALPALPMIWGMYSLVIAMVALLPFLVAITVLKWQKFESRFAYALAGAIISIVCIVAFFGWGVGRLMGPGDINASFPIILAGAAAGLTYRLCEKLILASLPELVTP